MTVLKISCQDPEKFGFVKGNVNPCLYVKKSNKGIVYVALYVGDNLMIGDVEANDNAMTALKKPGRY